MSQEGLPITTTQKPSNHFTPKSPFGLLSNRSSAANHNASNRAQGISCTEMPASPRWVCFRDLKAFSYLDVDLDAVKVRGPIVIQAHLPRHCFSQRAALGQAAWLPLPCVPGRCLLGQGRGTPCCVCLPGRTPAYHARSRPTAGDTPASRCCLSFTLCSLTAVGFSPRSESAWSLHLWLLCAVPTLCQPSGIRWAVGET